MLKGKTIVLGVTGGIAVYKSVDVVSRLVKLGANVKVIMTEGAKAFVTPLTFQSMSQNYVVSDMFEEPRTWDVEHIALAKQADLFLIAPATANVIGKVINGIADDMLTTTVMATKAPVVFAPAMNTNMYTNPIVQGNIKKLKIMGYKFIDPASGRLACGDVGEGKLASPEDIVDFVVRELKATKDLVGKTVLVTAGPTREALDPVRFLSNHSSGKMGYAIAKEAYFRGAEVVLVSGPVNLDPPKGVKVIQTESAEEMYNAVMEHVESDIIIKSAAVSDYRPAEQSKIKIKKSDDDLTLKLARNKDILFEVGKVKKDQFLVGFAAETNDVLENAKKKIEKKNLDLIVANDVTAEGAGFKTDTNIVSLIDREGNVKQLDLMTKEDIATKLMDEIISRVNA